MKTCLSVLNAALDLQNCTVFTMTQKGLNISKQSVKVQLLVLANVSVSVFTIV